MRKPALIYFILFLVCCQSVTAQQIYFQDKIGPASTPMDTTLYWYGVYRKQVIRPKVIEQRLFLKPVKVHVKKDSCCLDILTSDTTQSDFLIGFKEPVVLDSFPDFHFLIDHNFNEHSLHIGKRYTYSMGEMGLLKMYVNGISKSMEDSLSVEKYQLFVSHQCYATPYMRLRGWQYNIDKDVYQSCVKQEINDLLGIRKGILSLHDLPFFIGAIDLNNDKLLDLIFVQKNEYYMLLTNGINKKHYFTTVKKMKFEFGFY